MISRKKIIGIVLFILIGFAMFTFANPSDGLEPITELNDKEVIESVKDEPTNVTPDVPVNNPVPVDNAPVITVEPKVVKIVEGYEYNVLNGVVVTDDKDTNLVPTASLTISGEEEIGTYKVTYSVTDSANNTATEERTIIVLGKDDDEDNDHYTNEEEVEFGSDFLDEDDTPDYDYNPSIDFSNTTKTSVVYDKLPELDVLCTDNYYGTKGVTCNVDSSKINPNKVGTYEVTITATDILGNETINKFDYEVTKRVAKVVIDNKASVYGNKLKTLTYTTSDELKEYPIGIALTKEDGLDVNTYKITGEYSNENYDVTFVDGEYEITKRPITLKALNQTSVYGNEISLDQTKYQITSGNIVGTDNLDINLSVEDIKNVGTYDITLTANNSNYEITPVNGIYTITKKAAKVLLDAKSSVYGSDIVALTYITEGLVGTDTLEVIATTTATKTSAVGNYNITATVKDNANYSVTVVGNTYTITKAIFDTANIRFDDVNVTYDGNSYSAIVVGLPNEVEVTYSNNNNVVNAGSEDVTATFTYSDNYEPTTLYAKVTVNPRSITVKADDKKVTYGDLDKELTYTVVDGTVIGNDNLNIELSRETGSNAGSYKISGIYNNSNYNVTILDGIYTIEKKNIDVDKVNVSFNNIDVVYDGESHTALISGNLNEVLDVEYLNNTRTEAGTQTATATLFVKDIYMNNYTVSNNTKVATINIRKANPNVPEIDDLKADEGTKLSDITLPENFTLKSDDKTLTLKETDETGSEEVVLTYCPVDTVNYNCVDVTVDVTINAKYFTVTFKESENATEAFDTQKVRLNHKASLPKNEPAKANWKFTGWNVDVTNTVVTSDMTVIAQFSPLQTGLVIYEKPNAHFEFTQDRNNTDDELIRNIIIVKEVYADGNEIETTSYTTDFDLKTTGNKTLVVSENNFTATHSYKVVGNIAYQTKFEVIYKTNGYRKTKHSTCTGYDRWGRYVGCDSNQYTEDVGVGDYTFLEVVEHYNEGITVSKVNVIYTNNSTLKLDVSSKVRWSRYESDGWYDPVRIASRELYTDYQFLSSNDIKVKKSVDSKDLQIKYVDIEYTRDGYGSYRIRFEMNSDKVFTAISETRI